MDHLANLNQPKCNFIQMVVNSMIPSFMFAARISAAEENGKILKCIPKKLISQIIL